MCALRWLAIGLTAIAVAVQAAPPVSIYVRPAGGGDGTIGNPTDLQTALTTAALDGATFNLYLQTGLYLTSGVPFQYHTVSTAIDEAVLVSGGWNSTYTAQDPNPGATQLKGGGVTRVFDISASGAACNASFTLEYVTVAEGFTSDSAYPGAGLCAVNLGGARLGVAASHCDFTHNVAFNPVGALCPDGGGVYATCELSLRDCTIAQNQAAGGGGVFLTYAPPYGPGTFGQVDQCTFMDNLVTVWHGANLMAFYQSANLSGSTFMGISGGSSSFGSGVYCQGADLNVDACRFLGNVAAWWGGAIQGWDCNLNVLNSFFYGNAAGASGNGAGGAINAYDPDHAGSPRQITLTNCSFLNNQTRGFQAKGAAVFNQGQSPLTVLNCIFWDNWNSSISGPANTGVSGLYNGGGGTGTARCSDVQNGLGDTNCSNGGDNLNAPPGFTDADGHIGPTSPCIDAGDTGAVAGVRWDLFGNLRTFDGNLDNALVPDIGCHEYAPFWPQCWTLGTQMELVDRAFGAAAGSVYVEYEQGGKPKRVKAKVVTWAAGNVVCTWPKALAPGMYRLWVLPKTAGAVPIAMGRSYAMAPEIEWLVPTSGCPGDVVTVGGLWFTNKKPKVALRNATTNAVTSCKTAAYFMDPATGMSWVRFAVPSKAVPGDHYVRITPPSPLPLVDDTHAFAVCP